MRITFYNFLAIIAIFHLLIPTLLLLWLWRGKSGSRFTWFLKNLLSLAYFCLLFVAGFWEELSYYCRVIMIIVYIICAAKSALKFKSLPMYLRMVYVDWLFVFAGIALSGVLIYYIITAFGAYTYKETPVKLSFPFKNGTYMIAFGGDGQKNPLMNYHYRFPLYSRSTLDISVKYAVDIVKLNSSGKSGKGFLSRDNRDYEIYGETVYSPCNGVVAAVESHQPDESPYAYNYPNSPGNSIVIKYENFYILLGHLKKDTILVKPGDEVKQGQPLARVGNSGWSTEPHLHIQATNDYEKEGREGKGIPILFDGTFPVKNHLFFR